MQPIFENQPRLRQTRRTSDSQDSEGEAATQSFDVAAVTSAGEMSPAVPQAENQKRSQAKLQARNLMGLRESIASTKAQMSRKMRLIAEFILANPTRFIKMTAKDICAELETSDPTLIRFCQKFGYAGLAEFRIDLAVELASKSESSLVIEPTVSDRRRLNSEAKQEIAECAMALTASDRTIILDNGSTVEQLARLLKIHSGLTVMTSGLGVASQIIGCPQHRVILTGGEIRPGALSMGGRLVEMAIREMRFDTAYVGADSIDPQAGLSTFLEDEAHQTRAMVFAARRLVVLADESKLNKPSLHWICDVRNIDTLVTNAPLDHPTIAAIQHGGPRVISTKSSHQANRQTGHQDGAADAPA